MLDFLPLILSIINEGMKLWSDSRRTRFLNDYHDILEELSEAENKSYPDYNDSDVDLLTEKLVIFLEAYRSEIGKEHASKDRQRDPSDR
jgi:hypothetical protein